MSIPDWASLWSKEPALRPEGLTFHPRKEYVKHKWDAAINPPEIGYHEAHYTHIECEIDSWDYDGNGEASDELAAALCRDAAVRWLAAEGKFPTIYEGDPPHVDPVTGKFIEVWWHDHPKAIDEHVVFNGPTLDAALFAACLAVINARSHDASSGAQV